MLLTSGGKPHEEVPTSTGHQGNAHPTSEDGDNQTDRQTDGDAGKAVERLKAWHHGGVGDGAAADDVTL